MDTFFPFFDPKKQRVAHRIGCWVTLRVSTGWRKGRVGEKGWKRAKIGRKKGGKGEKWGRKRVEKGKNGKEKGWKRGKMGQKKGGKGTNA